MCYGVASLSVTADGQKLVPPGERRDMSSPLYVKPAAPGGGGGLRTKNFLELRIRGRLPLAPPDEDKQGKPEQERAHDKAGNRMRGGI